MNLFGDGDLVSAVLLCDVEHLVAFGDEAFYGRDVFALLACKAERHGNRDDRVLPREMVAFNGCTEPFCALLGVFRSTAVEQQDEFFAAVACKEVGFALFVVEDTCDFFQHQVAALVAPGIVDALEMVHIDHDGVNVAIVALGKRQFTEASVHEGAAVWNLGEGVLGGGFVEVAVESLFAWVLEFYLEDHFADLQAFFGIQPAFLHDGTTVYEGAVGAA